MKLDHTEPKTTSEKTENKPTEKIAKWLRLLAIGLASLFVGSLLIQLVRGKLWVVGAEGVWLLFFSTLVATAASIIVEKPERIKVLWTGFLAKSSVYGLAVIFLTGFGLWLRIWGQKIGLPYVIPADESLVVDAATRVIQTGNFDPQMYYYPSFYIYLEAIVGGLHFLWGSFSGLYTSLNDLPDRTFAITTAPQLYLWQRTLTAIFGAAAIPLAYGVVKRIWQDRRAALLVAGFVAFSSLATEHSHYITVDMPMATLALAALWPAWNIVEKGRTRDYIFTGILVGLAFGTKWNGLTVVILPLAAHLFRLIKTRPPEENAFSWVAKRYFSAGILLAGLATVATFLITTPFIFGKIRGYTDAFQAIITKYRLSNADYATDYPFIGNLQAIWEDSLFLFLPGIGGVLLLAFRRKSGDWLALCFPLIYLASINGYRLIYRRNVLPLTLYMALFAGIFSIWAFDQLVKRLPHFKLNKTLSKSAAIGLPVLILVVAMWSPLNAIFYGNQFNDQPFSYERVESWLKQEAGPGALKLVEMRPQQWGGYPNLLAYTTDSGASEFSLDYLRERGIQYVAINREQEARLNRGGSYAELLQPGLIAQKIETKAEGKPGPAYDIVRTGVTSATLKLQHPLNADFGGKLRLLGLNSGKVESTNSLYFPAKSEARTQPNWPIFKPGEVLGLTAYWEVLAPLAQDYTVFIHLRPVDNPEVNAANRDAPPLLGAFPTSQWKPGKIVTDNPNLALHADLAPGDYNLVLGLYLNDGKFTPLPLADGTNSVLLGNVTIK